MYTQFQSGPALLAVIDRLAVVQVPVEAGFTCISVMIDLYLYVEYALYSTTSEQQTHRCTDCVSCRKISFSEVK